LKKDQRIKKNQRRRREDDEDDEVEQIDTPVVIVKEGQVPQFSFVDEIIGHHFNEMSEPCKPRFPMKEWKRLQEGLPEGIYVVASSNKTHLLSALIIGPSNTIYYNSYFVFDIGLPYNYPGYPPKVFYRSCGHKLHPNLNEDGTVCLSLLGTWSGDQSERWNANQSSILQILVSIQGLVLGVKDPYFLEAGYDKLKGTKEGASRSHAFNELSLILSLKNRLQYYENPPPEFKDIIRTHFKENRHEIFPLIQSCNASPENPQQQSNDPLKSIAIKFNVPDTLTKGFVNLLSQDLQTKFSQIKDD